MNMVEATQSDPMMEKPFSPRELYNTDLITGELRDALTLSLRSIKHVDSSILVGQIGTNPAQIASLSDERVSIVSTLWSWDEFPSIYAVYRNDYWDYLLHKGTPDAMGFLGFGERHDRPNTRLVVDNQSKRISRVDVLSPDGFLFKGETLDVAGNGNILKSGLLISQMPVVACVVFVDCVGIGANGARVTGINIHE